MKPVLIGQGPPRNGAGKRAFDGRSGRFLAKLLDLTLEEFLDEVCAVNLLSEFCGKQRKGKGDLFPAHRAEGAARKALPRLRGGLVIAAGKQVAEAFGVKARYFEEVEIDGCLLVTIPHPSGVNRWWNDPKNKARAARELKRLLK